MGLTFGVSWLGVYIIILFLRFVGTYVCTSASANSPASRNEDPMCRNEEFGKVGLIVVMICAVTCFICAYVVVETMEFCILAIIAIIRGIYDFLENLIG